MSFYLFGADFVDWERETYVASERERGTQCTDKDMIHITCAMSLSLCIEYIYIYTYI